MKVLHYSLGFPPYRTGGLTKYCMDLMINQLEQGNQVALLWPGKITLSNRDKTYVKRKKEVQGIESFEVINPLPIPYDEGIMDTEAFMMKGSLEAYERFFQDYRPCVFFVHSLMGMHKELLEAAHNNNVKVVFITHDYFGICPRVTLYYNGGVCSNNENCEQCAQCNRNALSIKKMIALQSPIYRRIKDTYLVKILRKRHRSEENFRIENDIVKDEAKAQSYVDLRKYYLDLLSQMDVVFYNSSVAKERYEQYFMPKKSKIIHITHNDLKDCRKKKHFGEVLKILYLAPLKEFKGYFLLRDAVERLYQEGRKNFSLTIFGEESFRKEYLIVKDKYQYNELDSILTDADVLVAPSIWYETFGFTVAEALYSGTPVIVTDRVGAKDLVEDGYNGYIIKPTLEELYAVLVRVYDNRTLLKQFNENILHMQLPEDELIDVERVKAFE